MRAVALRHFCSVSQSTVSQPVANRLATQVVRQTLHLFLPLSEVVVIIYLFLRRVYRDVDAHQVAQRLKGAGVHVTPYRNPLSCREILPSRMASLQSRASTRDNTPISRKGAKL